MIKPYALSPTRINLAANLAGVALCGRLGTMTRGWVLCQQSMISIANLLFDFFPHLWIGARVNGIVVQQRIVTGSDTTRNDGCLPLYRARDGRKLCRAYLDAQLVGERDSGARFFRALSWPADQHIGGDLVRRETRLKQSLHRPGKTRVIHFAAITHLVTRIGGL